MSWTDERIDRLKAMWAEGKTASAIAEELGGVSRNAVIGKAHRLGLDSRPSPVKAGEEKAAPAAAAPAPATAPPAERSTPSRVRRQKCRPRRVGRLAQQTPGPPCIRRLSAGRRFG